MAPTGAQGDVVVFPDRAVDDDGGPAVGEADGADGANVVQPPAADVDVGVGVELSTGAAGTQDDDVPEPASSPNELDCAMPALPIARSPACAEGAPYPACKWAMPGTEGSGGTYRRWRNTIDEHTWGRPALVGVLLGMARAFHERFPDQELLIGDLDAPGPRHQTHKTGVDVDLYLPHTLMVENLGGRRYRDNYRRRTTEEVEAAREKVELLARILAVCTEGRVRIYYNDTTVRDRFHAWFDARGYETPFGRPMQRHNRLHDFHFHVTIADDTPVPRLAERFEGEHPVREIPDAPEIEGVTVFRREPGAAE